MEPMTTQSAVQFVEIHIELQVKLVTTMTQLIVRVAKLIALAYWMAGHAQEEMLLTQIYVHPDVETTG
jgi:hypothetical protein